MKKLLAILIISPLFFIASVSNSQNSKSLSSSYDGIWEGSAYTTEGSYSISMEIENGIMSGFVEDTKIKGYINADNNLITSPFNIVVNGTVSYVIGETKFMSPDRMEGIYKTDTYRHKWFAVKAGTDKPEATISNFQINDKEPWTGKFKVEETPQVSGIWAMKQEEKVVNSTKDSDYEFKGIVQGNKLKGRMEYVSGYWSPLSMEMSTDSMSFKGIIEVINRPYHLKGKRIE
jgi:hypothetical protein